MEKCHICNVWLTVCPCCSLSFCPDCKSGEDDLIDQYGEED